MNQKSSLREDLKFVSWMLTGNIQAALVSALTFAMGAVIPLIVALLAPAGQIAVLVAGSTLLALASLGALGASAGGAALIRGAARVTLWGALAMAATATVGRLFGVTIG